MAKEDMVDQINKELIDLPDRKSSKHDVDILKNYKFTNEVDADGENELDPFKRELPPSFINY